MPQGTCLCEDVKVSYTGEPKGKALCHCVDCRKITGSVFSTNYLIPEDAFTLETGQPKSYAKKTDSGNSMTSFFCGNCGTTIWRQSTKYPGVMVLRAGVIDGDIVAEKTEFDSELYVPRRAQWLPQQPGAKQYDGTM